MNESSRGVDSEQIVLGQAFKESREVNFTPPAGDYKIREGDVFFFLRCPDGSIKAVPKNRYRTNPNVFTEVANAYQEMIKSQEHFDSI